MVDLTKFSKADLKKTAEEINTYLKKADETEFDPNETTPKGPHLEDKLNGSTKKIEDSGSEETTKSAVKKADFPNNESEQMTEPSQGDVMSQILQLLQEINGKLNKPAEPAMPAPAPTDQIQHAETPSAPVATPSTAASTSTTTDGKKGDININVTKAQVEEILKGMGLAPSTATPKPKQETGHPIEKGTATLTLKEINKMSWDELNDYNATINPGPYY